MSYRAMYGLTMDVDEQGRIVIAGEPDDHGESTVIISVDQVDLVIEWLKAAKQEAIAIRKSEE